MSGRALRCLLPLYLVLELILGILIHTASPTYFYMYLSLVVASLFCLALYKPTARWTLTQTAFLFTLAADYLLVVLGSYHTLAMLLFSVTQLCYAARLTLDQEKRMRRIHLTARATLVLLAVAITALVLGKNTDALSVISLFYFSNLLITALFATAKWRSEPLFAVGLWLFVLCDIFIGFSMLGGYLPLGQSALIDFLASPPLNMAWVFYLPSQVLISISTMERQQLSKN